MVLFSSCSSVLDSVVPPRELPGDKLPFLATRVLSSSSAMTSGSCQEVKAKNSTPKKGEENPFRAPQPGAHSPPAPVPARPTDELHQLDTSHQRYRNVPNSPKGDVSSSRDCHRVWVPRSWQGTGVLGDTGERPWPSVPPGGPCRAEGVEGGRDSPMDGPGCKAPAAWGQQNRDDGGSRRAGPQGDGDRDINRAEVPRGMGTWDSRRAGPEGQGHQQSRSPGAWGHGTAGGQVPRGMGTGTPRGQKSPGTGTPAGHVPGDRDTRKAGPQGRADRDTGRAGRRGPGVPELRDSAARPVPGRARALGDSRVRGRGAAGGARRGGGGTGRNDPPAGGCSRGEPASRRAGSGRSPPVPSGPRHVPLPRAQQELKVLRPPGRARGPRRPLFF